MRNAIQVGMLMFATTRMPEGSEGACQEAVSCTERHNTLQSLGQAKLVLHRKHFSPPSTGNLTCQTWRGKDATAQPASHIDVREHA